MRAPGVMMRALGVIALVLGLSVVPGHAGPLGEDLHDECRSRGVPVAICDQILVVEDGLARPGLTVADHTTGPSRVDVVIADFYFRSRLTRVRDGQTIVFVNDNPAGGNRHSVSSSDLGGPRPVLPVPGSGFGGGRAFRSGILDPGASFTLTIDLATIHPDASVPLPNGDHLISFFCYIHGASQMNGQLLVSAG